MRTALSELSRGPEPGSASPHDPAVFSQRRRELRKLSWAGGEVAHGPLSRFMENQIAGGQAALRHARYAVAPGADETVRRVPCGSPGRDVDHDLIAAGHPRLNFEFSVSRQHAASLGRRQGSRAEQDAPERGRADFEQRAWVYGQLVSAHAALELLADRADGTKVWPEFAEHDCYACHHNLQSPSWRQERAVPGNLGAIPWNRWYLTMTPRALTSIGADDKLLDPLRKRLQEGWKNPKEIRGLAKRSADDLHKLIGRLNDPKLQLMPPVEIIREVLSEDKDRAGRSRDDANQICLSLAAMCQAQIDMGAGGARSACGPPGSLSRAEISGRFRQSQRIRPGFGPQAPVQRQVAGAGYCKFTNSPRIQRASGSQERQSLSSSSVPGRAWDGGGFASARITASP